MQTNLILNKFKNHYTVIFVICFSFIIYAQFDHADKLSKQLTQDSLFQSNQVYLLDIEKRVTANYVRLALINATFSTMETSNVGISFFINAKLNIGKELKQLESLTDRATYYSSTVLLFNTLLKKIYFFTANISPILFIIFVFFAFLYSLCGLMSFSAGLKHAIIAGRFVLTLLIICHLIIPYAIHLANIVTQSIEQERKIENMDYFKNLNHEYENAKDKSSVQHRAESLLRGIENVLVDIEIKIESLLIHILEYIIAEVLETILIPLLLLIGLFFLSRKLTSSYLIHPLE